MSNYEQEHEDLIQENDELTAEVERLRQWVADLQSGMYVNCVYCGHRYGPDKTTPVSHAELLKAHIEVCPDHPMSALKKERDDLRLELAEVRENLKEIPRLLQVLDGMQKSNDTLRRMLEGRARYHQKVEEHLRKISAAALPVYDDALSERIWVGMGDSLRRDDEGPLPTSAQVDATLVEARERELANADALAASFVNQFPEGLTQVSGTPGPLAGADEQGNIHVVIGGEVKVITKDEIENFKTSALLLDRYICTKDAPWTPEKGRKALHPDAVEVGEQEDGWPSGDLQKMRCPHCGAEWKEELPQ